MDDATLLALCVWDEARGECADGKAAVARVVLNRKRLRFFCPDGTIAGAVLAKDQFSGFWFDMHDGHYVRVCHTAEEAEARAAGLLALAVRDKAWTACRTAATEVLADTYAGEDYGRLTDDTVLYLNPSIVSALPAWATSSAFVCSIPHHDFYRASAPTKPPGGLSPGASGADRRHNPRTP